jgi:two-component system alkaline phosphatase synthesis response regulator PhoP
MKGNILVVEDEQSIQNIVRTYLEASGFTVRCVGDGREALSLAESFAPDLIVLDINLPGMNGLDVAARVRQQSDVYIIMLTARGEEHERIMGLNLGADDYMTKPFSPRELVARVEAVLRRQRATATGQTLSGDLRYEHVSINADKYEAWTATETLSLTNTEFNLLLELMQHGGLVLSREQLLDRVWGEDFYGNDRVVDVYVGQVRRKLEAATGLPLIETVRGVGYKFVDRRA